MADHGGLNALVVEDGDDNQNLEESHGVASGIGETSCEGNDKVNEDCLYWKRKDTVVLAFQAGTAVEQPIAVIIVEEIHDFPIANNFSKLNLDFFRINL